jgi:hypothetical protein
MQQFHPPLLFAQFAIFKNLFVLPVFKIIGDLPVFILYYQDKPGMT